MSVFEDSFSVYSINRFTSKHVQKHYKKSKSQEFPKIANDLHSNEKLHVDEE